MNKNKLVKLWFNSSEKIRFLIVGGFNFSVSYVIYSLIIFFAGESYYQYSLAFSWLVTSLISYTTQRIFVFNVRGNLVKQYFKCCITWFFSYMLNAFLLEILVRNINCNVYLSQIIANFSAAIFTYIMFKIFAFKSKG